MQREFLRRQMDALKVYEPLPFQAEFHACKAKECLLMKGNRAGGSLAGFVEDARAALNLDPYKKYPAKNGRIVCLGYGESHIGRVIFKYLMRPGAFSIIWDDKERIWRTFRPWPQHEQRNGKYGDEGLESKSFPAPPLIPQRYVEKIVWYRRAHRIFSRIDIKGTGYEIHSANSAGDASQVQGIDVNLYHIDEDLACPGWYEEAMARVTAVNGLIRWTAMPHAKNDDLSKLIERCQAEDADPNVTRLIRATIFDNPYLPREAVEKSVKIWMAAGTDVLRKRAYGELTTNSSLVYPTFSRVTHDYRSHQTDPCVTLQKTNGDPPEDWCRYIAVDPGTTVLAILYAAIPPNNEHIYIYDEDYILGGNATKFGEAIERKAKGRHIQSIIIDMHGARLRELGSGMTPRGQFAAQLRERDVYSVENGYDFAAGCDNIEGREMIVREALAVRDDGSPRLIINPERCGNLCREMERFRKKTVQRGTISVVLDKSDRRYNTHAIECLEYIVAHNPTYVPPPARRAVSTWLEMVLERHRQRRLEMQYESGDHGITLGPRGDGERL